MKKLLLTLAACAAALCLNAQETPDTTTVVLSMNDVNTESIQGTFVEDKLDEEGAVTEAAHWKPVDSFTLGGFSFSFASPEGAQNPPAFYKGTEKNPDWTVRLYKDCSMTLTAPEGAVMTQIVFKGSNGKADATLYSVNTGELSGISTSAQTWTGSASEIVFSYGGTFRIKTMTVSYLTAEGPAVETLAAPTFSPASGTEFDDTLDVTITGPEGASIYYTLDGTAPTAESTLYAEPITLTMSATVKAIAVQEGWNNSPVATAVYVKPLKFSELSKLIEYGLTDEETVLNFTGEAAVTYANGKNIWIQQAGEKPVSLLLYAKAASSLENGAVITGFSGTFKNYYATYEVMLSDEPTVAADPGAPVSPRLMKLADITAADQNAYIAVSHMDVAASGTDFVAKQDGTEMPIYNKFKLDIEEAANQDMVAIVSYYQAKGAETPALQLYPISFQNASAVTGLAADAAPAAEYYTPSGIRVHGAPAPGLYIVRQGQKATKVIVK